MTGVILGIVGLGIFIIRKWDRPLALNGRMYLGIAAGALSEGYIIYRLAEAEGGYQRILLAVIGGSLLLACLTDHLLCQVYHFTWWPALTAAAILLIRKCFLLWFWGKEWFVLGDILAPLLVFLFLQFVLFRRMYGRADYYAFCICAIVETAGGMGIGGYLTHMLLAYLLLFPVQALRHNIGTGGKLKQPVPFLPYITAAFWLTVILAEYFAL